MSSSYLSGSLSSVLGGRTATAMAKGLGLQTVEDLLRHYPRRYAERGDLTDLSALVEGEPVTVLAEISEVTVRSMRNRRGSILEALISDGRSSMSVTFFNQRWREREFRAGRRGLFAGQVSSFRGKRQLAHPECILFPDGVTDDAEAVAAFAGALIPIYPASSSVTTWQIQSSIGILLDQLGELPDPIPPEILAARGLCSLTEAMRFKHRPSTRAEIAAADDRLVFEEAFTLQIVLALRRAEVRSLPATRRAPAVSPLLAAFDARLPFELTEGQREVGAQIEADLARDYPMHRLLQGDVGSGKTVVAVRAMLHVVDAGGQAALLAPTEVLASQHDRSIRALLGPLAARGQLGGADVATRVAMLSGSQRTAERRTAMLDIVSGEAGIVVGTHALIQDTVEFHDLALVIVDEQHRFGVEQRAALSAKSRDGSRPHVLVMTATPIPRTVAMTAFGDVDVSTLTELPAGRGDVSTFVVAARDNPHHAARVWDRVREEVSRGARVFVVCPRIGDETSGDEVVQGDATAADAASLTGVIPLAGRLAAQELTGLRIGMMHGRMSGEEKDDVMRRFSGPEAVDTIDVLVATTVIEVGVDVPRATTMVVTDADRFGISQLHQLRGRIGRGELAGLCLLLTDSEAGSPARRRLEAVAATTDGFELSAEDLRLRREGDVLGSAQSGRDSSLRLLQVTDPDHAAIIAEARSLAQAVVEADPELSAYPALADAVAALREHEQAQFLEKA